MNKNTILRMLFLRIAAILCLAACAFAGGAPAEPFADSARAADSACVRKTLSPVPVQQSAPPPRPSVAQRTLFWSTWGGYHAAFTADFAMTGLILDRGGWETDPVYTLFGNKNMAGVIGSGMVVHAVFSIVSLELYNAAFKRRDAWRFLLYAAAIGVNSYFIGIHTYATISNIGVYNRMAR